MAINSIYKGISSNNYLKNGTFSLTDLELVKENIKNHIFTRKGERVYMPNFGTNIPDLIFEPLDSLILNQVESELLEVVKQDPRVELIGLNVQPYYKKNTIIAILDLYYIELDLSDGLNLNIKFETI